MPSVLRLPGETTGLISQKSHGPEKYFYIGDTNAFTFS